MLANSIKIIVLLTFVLTFQSAHALAASNKSHQSTAVARVITEYHVFFIKRGQTVRYGYYRTERHAKRKVAYLQRTGYTAYYRIVRR